MNDIADIADVETVVVGAGIVGLSCAAALAEAGREVIVLEAEPAVGQITSARNSEVIHAGIYYPPGSLKARLCVEGRKMLYAFCAEHGVTAKPIGKLIVATEESQVPALRGLLERGLENGVDDLAWLEGGEARAMEPALACYAAVHSPSTGIVDSHNMMVAMEGIIDRYGGQVICSTPVRGLTISGDRIHVHTSDMTLAAREVVNAAGLAAVPMARKTRGLTQSDLPTARYAKGNYFKLSCKAPFSRLIYPAPVEGGLGVHITLDLGGQARFGPDVEWLDDTSVPEGGFDYEVDPARCESFYEAIRTYWPDMPDDSLEPDYSGVRPKIARALPGAADFRIDGPSAHGVAGLVNLFGIESPGLTSSLAIGAHVQGMLGQDRA